MIQILFLLVFHGPDRAASKNLLKSLTSTRTSLNGLEPLCVITTHETGEEWQTKAVEDFATDVQRPIAVQQHTAKQTVNKVFRPLW